MAELTLGGEQLATKVAHPFYTEERGWAEAGRLKAGDHVCSARDRWGVVQGISLHPTPHRLYNLTVDADHTGNRRWLVHKSGPCDEVLAPTPSGSRS